jgi:hypothetical protein
MSPQAGSPCQPDVPACAVSGPCQPTWTCNGTTYTWSESGSNCSVSPGVPLADAATD